MTLEWIPTQDRPEEGTECNARTRILAFLGDLKEQESQISGRRYIVPLLFPIRPFTAAPNIGVEPSKILESFEIFEIELNVPKGGMRRGFAVNSGADECDYCNEVQLGWQVRRVLWVRWSTGNHPPG